MKPYDLRALTFDNCGHILRKPETTHLASASLIILFGFLVLPTFLVTVSRMTWSTSSPWALRRCTAWVVLTYATLMLWRSIPAEPSDLQRALRRQVISHQLNPSLTMLISFCETRSTEPISAVLTPSQLAPFASTQRMIPLSHKPNIIVVAIESLRHDTVHLSHQGREVLPTLNRLATQGLEFSNAYAQSTHSDYADVCLLSSLYPLRTREHHFYRPDDPWPKTQIYDILKPQGYATAIISSQNEMWGGMAHFLASDNLDYFYHPETADHETNSFQMDPGFARELKSGALRAGKFTDQHTTSEAIRWIREQVALDKPFFLAMNFQSSHFPYLLPASTALPFQPCGLAPGISFADYPPAETTAVRNAYFNAIHECDRQLERLVASLKSLHQLDQTIIVVTGENGEAFHECGSVTHAREPVGPAIHVACIMHAPQLIQPGVEEYPLEHVDLVPTLLGLLKLGPHANFQGLDVLSDHRPAILDRLTFCHVNSSFSRSDAVMLAARWKLVDDRTAGRVHLYDVVDDPNEDHDLIDEQPDFAARLLQVLKTWRERQLAYYHFPNYYLNYYPPLPPRWNESAEPGQSRRQQR